MTSPIHTPRLIALAATCILALTVLPAHAVVDVPTATDLALPVYVSGLTWAATHGVDCSSANQYFKVGACDFSLSTVTTGSNCLSEVVSAPTLGTLPTPSGPTLCSVLIGGPVTFGSSAGECNLSATQSLAVSFTSGRYVAFNGQFSVTAVFIPTSTTATGGTRTFTVKLTGGSLISSGLALAGSISAVFNLRFGTALHPSCPNLDVAGSLNSKGGLAMAGPGSAPGGTILMHG